MDEILQAYLDTNALLEFRALRDNDWNDLLEAEHVILVTSPVVLDELQGIKDGRGRELPRRKKQRAGELLISMEAELFPGNAKAAGPIQIKKGVYLTFDDRPTPAEIFTKYSLDPSLSDARLVGAVLAARDEGRRVCLASNDAGPRWQAKSRGIRAYDLPENWRLKDEPDAMEAELRDVKKRLAVFESRAPKLSARTKTGDTFIRHELPRPRMPLAEQVEGYMELLRVTYPLYGEDPLGRFGYVRGLLSPPAHGEIARYDKRIDVFRAKAHEVLPKIIEFRNELDLYIPLDGIVVANEGTQPAENMELVLRPPPAATFPIERPVDQRPRFPEPPEQPRSVFDAIGAASAMAAFNRVSPLIHSTRFNLEPVSLAPEWEVNAGEASITVGTLRHRDTEELPPIWVKLASYEDAVGFGIPYEINAYNVPHAVTGRLDVALVKSSRMRELDLDRWNDRNFDEGDQDTPGERKK